ncbi:phosphatase PAP2 family protein [Actinomadura sp. HBU206391]|uniref:phosphatase PAP2 family protein n=1 Tax=Actinomadura sp. HBU206391 TaxID=2731692 RepID=UPI00164F7C14|nr:phosphatase PAP2 family protein [Actinomadura sp. HBU206391]MBC6461596.1 phosphatase PAP2 family protein [Actinomadura sp. HBU206391]
MAQTLLPASSGRTATRSPAAAQLASRPERPKAAAPPLWRELLVLVISYLAYTLTRLVLDPTSTSSAFTHADQVLGFERMLGLDVELGLNQALLDVPWLARAANLFYATAHFAVTLSVMIWLYRYRPRYYRWFRTSLIAATAIALVGFWVYPLAPPRFLPGHGFVDPVTALDTLGLYSAPGSGALTNQYAAMPSMHAGWALWCGFILVLLATQRWAKVLGMLYPATTILVILATANHYVLDVVAGITLIVGALSASWWFYRRSLILKKDGVVLREADLPAHSPAFSGDVRQFGV